MKGSARIASMGVALMLLGLPVYAAEASAAAGEDDAEDDDSKYVEVIIVRGERGDLNTLDRAMTVTGFNASMIQQFGIQNTNDLEILTPGFQIGPRSQGGGKNEDGHIVMRGVACDRCVNFFQDVGTAVYIDGVYSDQSYGLDQGAMFDVERVEIARGPQGTTGGKAAIAGSVNFVTTKPTDEWDMKMSAELTDQATQQALVAFGGPIMDSDFSYRLSMSSLTGDGLIENVGTGPDAAEPDQLIYSPQLRFKNDRLDVTARYSKLRDRGTPRVSLILGPRNTVDEFIMDANGNRVATQDPLGNPIMDAGGNIIYQRNPFFGIGQNPAVENCPGFNNDGTRTPGTPVVCDGENIDLKVDLNAPILQDNSQEASTLEAHFQLTDTHELVYKYGQRDTRQRSRNDLDGTSRQGGGVCSAIHPRVVSGELTEGQVHPRCALDGGGNGSYADRMNDYLFTSEQVSHELTMISNLDGPFNYTLGLTYIDGEEPYLYAERFNGLETGDNNLNNPLFYTDTSEACEAALEGFFGESGLIRNIRDPNHVDNAKAAGLVWGCHGADYAANWSDVTNGLAQAAGGSAFQHFYGNVSYTSQAVYGNAEYVLNDQWKVFGGVRFNDDHKEHEQNDFTGATQIADMNFIFGIHRSKHYDTQCCGYVGLELDASGRPIPDDRTLMDSKVADWRETTWNIGGEYAPNDLSMIYGRISKGYRPGGFAGFGHQLGEAMDAEEMINYETGYKGLFFDNRLQLEASAYIQDYSKYWVQSGRLRTPAEVREGESLITGETVVVGGTEIYGVELQYRWTINERLQLGGFYEYSGSSFGDYTTLYCCTPDGNRPPPSTRQVVDADGNTVTVNLSNFSGNLFELNFGGNSLRLTPNHKLSAALSYAMPLAADRGALDLVTLFNWRDRMYVDESNFDIYSVPAYTRWDFRANWVSPSGNLTLTGWVTNILDQVAVQAYSPREGNGIDGAIAGTVTDARRMGITLNYQM